MFRSRHLLNAAVKKQTESTVAITNNILRNKLNTSAAVMTDKFRLPARYGAGEKSVW